MSKMAPNGPDGWMFWCPGCDFAHGIGPAWTFNGDIERPTIQPSVLVVDGNPACHSFVTDGKIQFLGDSTHQYAGMTVDLPEWPFD